LHLAHLFFFNIGFEQCTHTPAFDFMAPWPVNSPQKLATINVATWLMYIVRCANINCFVYFFLVALSVNVFHKSQPRSSSKPETLSITCLNHGYEGWFSVPIAAAVRNLLILSGSSARILGFTSSGQVFASTITSLLTCFSLSLSDVKCCLQTLELLTGQKTSE